MRSTLAASFMFGTAMSLVVLAIAGEISLTQVLLGAGLAPVVVAGSVLGRRLHPFLDRGWLRRAVLLFAAVAALTAIGRAFS